MNRKNIKGECGDNRQFYEMKNCFNCGLGIKQDDDKISCFKYKTINSADEDKTDCLYYIETVVEEGEPLPALQHLLLKEEELKQRKMKGVI